jgi:MFS family permease
VGLIGSSIVTGILISRIGRYKLILVASGVVLAVGSLLMTRITSDTSNWALWSWMLVMGLGIGPSMSGFTVVVQNSAPANQLGAATSTLTFLRQVGGSVGLAIAGTLFSQGFAQKLPEQLLAHQVPGKLASRFGSGSAGGQGNLTGVDLAQRLRQTLPPTPGREALIQRIVAGVHDAFSLAVGQVFWLTVTAAVLALLAILALADIPLRDRGSLATDAAAAITGSETPVGPAASRAAQ